MATIKCPHCGGNVLRNFEQDPVGKWEQVLRCIMCAREYSIVEVPMQLSVAG